MMCKHSLSAWWSRPVVFKSLQRIIVKSELQGENETVLLYGAPSTGKTFTLEVRALVRCTQHAYARVQAKNAAILGAVGCVRALQLCCPPISLSFTRIKATHSCTTALRGFSCVDWEAALTHLALSMAGLAPPARCELGPCHGMSATAADTACPSRVYTARSTCRGRAPSNPGGRGRYHERCGQSVTTSRWSPKIALSCPRASPVRPADHRQLAAAQVHRDNPAGLRYMVHSTRVHVCTHANQSELREQALHHGRRRYWSTCCHRARRQSACATRR